MKIKKIGYIKKGNKPEKLNNGRCCEVQQYDIAVCPSGTHT